MKIRTMAAVTAAALFAIAGASFAQSGSSKGSDAKAKTGGSAAGAGQTAKSKCADLTGDKRAQCLKDEKKAAGAGSTAAPAAKKPAKQ